MDGFWIDFGRVWGGFGCVLGELGHSKSAALLAAPGVLNPTAFFACINILHVLTRGGQKLPKWSPKLTHVGPMLAHFSFPGAIFSHQVASGALLRLFWVTLVVFSGFGVAAKSILGGQDKVLEASKPHLLMMFGVSKHASHKCSSCNKTTIFAMFYKLRNMSHTATEHVFCIAFKAFLGMVHELLQKFLAGIHFLLFKTTLQRGGTCEAHGIGHVGLQKL